MKITSVIIPVFNEESIIQATLSQFPDNSAIEIIVVDGGSSDQTVKIVSDMGFKIIKSPLKGRANQMNYGAKIATGNIFLFLHADSNLPENWLYLINNYLNDTSIIAGAFELAINSSHWGLRIIEQLVNWRSHLLKLPYGDQGIFMKREIFEEMGGFPEIPIMEDYEMIQRLKKRGKIGIISAKISTSPRRWEKLGICKTTLINQLIIIGYHLKISPLKLKQLYQQKTRRGSYQVKSKK